MLLLFSYPKAQELLQCLENTLPNSAEQSPWKEEALFAHAASARPLFKMPEIFMPFARFLGPLWGLFAVNLFPLLGVLFLGWSVGQIILAYWTEVVIAGLFAVLKMAKAPFLWPPHSDVHVSSPIPITKATMIPLFVFSYGIGSIMTFGMITGMREAPGMWSQTESSAVSLKEIIVVMLICASVTSISYMSSYMRYFIKEKEYLDASVVGEMGLPGTRLVLLCTTMIAGLAFTFVLESSLILLIILISLKFAFDLRLYLGKHDLLSQRLKYNLVRMCLGVVCTIGSIWLISFPLETFRMSQRMGHWTETSGEITDVDTKYDNRHNTNTRRIFSSKIVYTYSVNDNIYASSRIGYGRAERQGNYTKGKRVTVYYDPANPRSAVLNRTVQFDWMIILPIALLLVMAIGSFLSVDLRESI